MTTITATAVPIRVRVVDDLNLQVVAAPVPQWIGAHILHPSSVRRNVTYPWALGRHDRLERNPYIEADMDRLFPKTRDKSKRDKVVRAAGEQLSLSAAGKVDYACWGKDRYTATGWGRISTARAKSGISRKARIAARRAA